MAAFPVRNILRPIFSRSIEHDKCQGTIYKGAEGVLTIIVQLIRSLLRDRRGR